VDLQLIGLYLIGALLLGALGYMVYDFLRSRGYIKRSKAKKAKAPKSKEGAQGWCVWLCISSQMWGYMCSCVRGHVSSRTCMLVHTSCLDGAALHAACGHHAMQPYFPQLLGPAALVAELPPPCVSASVCRGCS
jgi:hypothetical protein